MSEQALKRLDEILKRAQGAEGGGTALPVQHGPTAMIVGYGAWPMSLSRGPNYNSVVNGYRRVLARLDTALTTNRPGSEPPPVRIAYGNWPCALSNETASDSRGVLATWQDTSWDVPFSSLQTAAGQYTTGPVGTSSRPGRFATFFVTLAAHSAGCGSM
jgi:hypothetical protein